MVEIIVPAKYEPRPYQQAFHRAMDGTYRRTQSGECVSNGDGFKRAALVWHRRAGKDKACWCYLLARAAYEKGTYYYIFPTYTQGKKALWEAIGKDEVNYIEHIPAAAIIGAPNQTEMKINLLNGSVVQIVGAEEFNRLMGTNPRGLVFSEYSIQNPNCWRYMEPILMENGGWAIFNLTPRGKNHGYELWAMAQANQDEWYCSLQTIEDTGVISPDEIAKMRRQGVSEEFIQQEFYCSFEGSVHGAIYAAQIRQARADGRIGNVPHDPHLPVYTAWDLGIDDHMAIWFCQLYGQEVRLIDYLEGWGEGLPYYVREIKERQYNIGKHVLPHDIQVRELGTGKTRLEVLQGLGLDCEVLPASEIADGIEAVRGMFSRSWFDSEKCRAGLDALDNYKQKFDERKNTFTGIDKNWACHGSDAFRYLAVWERVGRQAMQIPAYAAALRSTTSYAGLW